ncbi:hypothetical protein KBC54_04585 [Patescibacteria group bacterium]|nr:hypothetical protein [Patescibacteria group bacterium]
MTIPRPIAVLVLSIPWIMALCAMGWLVYVRYPPTGVFTVSSVIDGQSPWINPFLPTQRVTAAGKQADGWVGQRIIDDPTYFTARVPGPYDSVDVTLEYRPLYQPMMEFGMVRDAAGTSLQLVPMYASELQKSDWQHVTFGSQQGYVRNSVPASRLSYAHPEGLAVWNATATSPLLSDPDHTLVSTAVSLRGSHDFYFVPAGGSVRAIFAIQAANRQAGSDAAGFRIFRDDEEIQQDSLGASGSRDRRLGQRVFHEVVIKDATPSVYRISFVASDDVFIREIQTTSQHWVVGPRVYFGDVVGYATSTLPGRAITNSRHIVAETFHPEGRQVIALGSDHIPVERTHTATRLDRTDSVMTPVSILAPKGDIRIIGDGYFALRDDAFFEPRPRRFGDGTDTTKEHIDVVMTPYVKPVSQGDGWYQSTFQFELNPSLDQLRFVLSAPGMLSRAGAVDVRRITLTYHRSAVTYHDWFVILRQELANAWHRL